MAKLRSRSCIIDGEAVACGDDGIALFERIRYRRFDSSVFMYAFDLIELTDQQWRRRLRASRRKKEESPGCGPRAPNPTAQSRWHRQGGRKQSAPLRRRRREGRWSTTPAPVSA